MAFNTQPSLEQLNAYNKETIAETLGIEIVEIGTEHLTARMPVNRHTHQALGMLHGGASCVLAEHVASIAANLCLNRDTHVALGLDLNTNYVRAVKSGYVYGKASPIHIGSRSQVWEIKITDEAGQLTSIARLTMMVIPVSLETMRKQIPG